MKEDSDSLFRLIRESWIPDAEADMIHARPLGGGCINQVYRVDYPGRPSAVAKLRSDAQNDFFPAEARGLEQLRAAISEAGKTGGIPVNKALRVPRVLGVSSSGILLEFISRGPSGSGASERFGRALAALHAAGSYSGTYGDIEDNYIGLTAQPNQASSGEAESWPGFFGRRRLGFQLELAESRGRADRTLSSGVRSLIGRLGDILPERPRAAALHGDLWGGNFFYDETGRAVLIDPAYYRGHCEADLAMTELFGGYGAGFYRGYREVIPDDGDYPRRREIYNLYHLLNHLNLFGSGYHSQVMGSLRALGF
jgi:protein-ribulosamine 3-kinase